MTMTASSPSIHRNIPDAFGTCVYDRDPEMERLLRLYMEGSLFDRVRPHFQKMGKLVGGVLETCAQTADRNPPVLHLRARNGAAHEWIEKHPAYKELERVAFSEFGLAAMSHRGGVLGHNDRMPPIVKYGLSYLFVQAEFGLCCPLSMTDALTRTLVKFGDRALIERFFEGLTAQDMDRLTQGAMFMTEQEVGSDVGGTSTTARFDNGAWRLTGDKWFCSNADAELAMVLARPEGAAEGTRGLSLFLLPRHLPDGSRNSFSVIRLKDKLGTRSMASGEVRLEGALAYLVGEEASGFKQMTDMINMSRLSNGMRSAGLMRRAFNEALFVAQERTAFGRRLVDLPLMRRQLIKMLTLAEQGRSIVFHIAETLRRADQGDQEAQKLMRILTPLAKFRTCRDARKVTQDGMEVRGGCGYIEEWSDARVVRDAMLGSIWEGTSNIVALDVVRSIRREGTLPVLKGYLQNLLLQAAIPAKARDLLGKSLGNVAAHIEAIAHDRNREIEVRQAASLLYRVTVAIIMAWEAGRMGRANRLALAMLTLSHAVLPRDPLAGMSEDVAVLDALLRDDPVAPEDAIALV